MDYWPHQELVHREVPSLMAAGERSICVASPTGAGKTLMQCRLLELASGQGLSASLYTNRRMLTEQTIRRLYDHGIRFGVRAAGFDDYQNFDAPIQLSSLQTENARVFESQKWLLHKADLVIIDEAHMQKSETAEKILAVHRGHNATVVGFTATPIGVNHIYSKLLVAGTTSSLRECGALVRCEVFAPSEIDTQSLKRQASGEFSVGELKKVIRLPVIFGQVLTHWRRLNPEQKPAILFAPGVEESKWFAQQFEKEGIRAAHIDGEDVYLDGMDCSSSRDKRDEVIGEFRRGDIKVLCNRFVLREGIDIPECYHGILACPIGSVVSYVQIVGRILRAHRNTPHVILQDHGGNYWRHGSPNADRDWESVWHLTDYQIGQQRIERLREKKGETEPIVCPKCGAVRAKGVECYKCGYRHEKSVRMVIQKDGHLKPIIGDILKPRKVDLRPDTEKLWDECYWRAKKAKKGMTFRQAEGLFFHDHHYWPPRTLPNMPTDPLNWDRKVGDVPFADLIKKGDMQ